jgi:BirA family biotin operon repressor/biotin-[acetyl-CoA-carboxylase] ligase
VAFDAERLRARFPGRAIHWRESIDSTMFEASRLAAEGCSSGTVIGADEQTAGYGRRQTLWHSEPESGLYLSVALRLALDPGALPLVTLALGLAAREAITETAGVECDLRWPNDVLIGDRKCAGILAQYESGAIIAGIGINVNHAAFPPELRDVATSLRIASGHVQSREDLAAALLAAIDFWCETLQKDGKQPILEMFLHVSSYVSGRRVQVDQDGAVVTGATAGLTASGFLLVRDGRGKEHTIIAGGVRPCS